MDGILKIETTAFVPLPFRVMSLVGLGLLCWASNLHILHLIGIDTSLILDTRTDKLPIANPDSRPDSPAFRSHSPHPLSASKFHQAAATNLYYPLYRIFAIFSAWTLANYLLFIHFVNGDLLRMDRYKAIPALAAGGTLLMLFCPFHIFQRRERAMFLQAVRRCLFVSTHQPVFFCDIVLADVLTSFAKVLGDVWISLNMLAPGGSLRMGTMDIQGWSEWIIPILMSLPYAIRLRQCLAEYSSSKGCNTRALLNAIKYATSFPVIFLSAAQKIVISDIVAAKGVEEAKSSTWHGEHQIFRLWFISVCVSSLYSFWWDVTNDWGLGLLRSSNSSTNNFPTNHRRSNGLGPTESPTLSSSESIHSTLPSTSSHPYGLRSSMLFAHPIVYYCAIVLNFVLRFTWSMKLSTHLHTFAELETGVLVLEACEVLRRWLWVFFRVEWEACKQGITVEDISLETRDKEKPIDY